MFDLPVELLPQILFYVLKPSQLSNICRVNKTFYVAAIPRLYYKVTVFSWHKDVKTKVVQLFATLANCPQLARHVQHLEIRDFPKNPSLSTDDRAQRVFDDVLRGLRNCINLRCCTWTRDGSLTSEILEALLCANSNPDDGTGTVIPMLSPKQLENYGLRELELNGHDKGLYDRALLLGFVRLECISLIMPTAGIVSLLPRWTSLNHGTLRRLTLICKSSSVVIDETLVTIASTLDQLEEFHLAGCLKVTHQGVFALLSYNTQGIMDLRLEGLSSRFDMTEFSLCCTATRAMRRLQCITLTLGQPLGSWLQSVLSLLAPAPLKVLQFYPTSVSVDTAVPDEFCKALVTAHGARLTRFAIHRMRIGVDAITNICERCPNLEQLFIVVPSTSLGSLGSALAKGKSLRVVHVNYPPEAQTGSGTFIPSDAVSVVNQCSPTLVQFGCNTRVWQVTNDVRVAEDGCISTCRVLSAYDGPDIPEAFLVVRT